MKRVTIYIFIFRDANRYILEMLLAFFYPLNTFLGNKRSHINILSCFKTMFRFIKIKYKFKIIKKVIFFNYER